MVWRIEFSNTSKKQLAKLDQGIAKKILNFLKNRIAVLENPKMQGKPLKGNFAQLWRYRIGDYRLICDIQENKLVILVLLVGHRKNIYDS